MRTWISLKAPPTGYLARGGLAVDRLFFQLVNTPSRNEGKCKSNQDAISHLQFLSGAKAGH